jgi:Flp pilus assembly protein TadD
MSRRRPAKRDLPVETPEALLCRRAWRFRRRGDERRAMLALREAASSHEQDAKLWALYGVQCMRLGHMASASQALLHAAWLRDRQHEHRKASVTRDVLARHTSGHAA